jgi:hypothetical protein
VAGIPSFTYLCVCELQRRSRGFRSQCCCTADFLSETITILCDFENITYALGIRIRDYYACMLADDYNICRPTCTSMNQLVETSIYWYCSIWRLECWMKLNLDGTAHTVAVVLLIVR